MLPPWYGQWCERDEVLERCPEAWCRRAGACGNAGSARPCLRTHQTMDEARDALSDTLRQMMRDMGKDPDAHIPEEVFETYEFQLKWAALKQGLEERVREETARGKMPV